MDVGKCRGVKGLGSRGACGLLLAEAFIDRGTKPKANRNEGEEAGEVRTGGY